MSPYITPPSKHGVMIPEDRQEVARSALVKGIESKMAVLIWRAAPGICSRTALSSALHGCVHLPLIVTLVITLELDQVLQAVVLDSSIASTSYSSSLLMRVVGGGGAGRQPGMGSGSAGDSLTTGKMG
jgi:hypothetical protein